MDHHQGSLLVGCLHPSPSSCRLSSKHPRPSRRHRRGHGRFATRWSGLSAVARREDVWELLHARPELSRAVQIPTTFEGNTCRPTFGYSKRLPTPLESWSTKASLSLHCCRYMSPDTQVCSPRPSRRKLAFSCFGHTYHAGSAAQESDFRTLEVCDGKGNHRPPRKEGSYSLCSGCPVRGWTPSSHQVRPIPTSTPSASTTKPTRRVIPNSTDTRQGTSQVVSGHLYHREDVPSRRASVTRETFRDAGHKAKFGSLLTFVIAMTARDAIQHRVDR